MITNYCTNIKTFQIVGKKKLTTLCETIEDSATDWYNFSQDFILGMPVKGLKMFSAHYKWFYKKV